MTIAEPKFISYEDPLSEGKTSWRYDISDGVRVDMASPTAYHQRIVQRVTRFLSDHSLRFADPSA